ncbi:uncharacterized protein JCM10292_006304 [Rhodotorula paludigena]|uniref:uncharacterized protein n=1 Tax=Rhodotorula paludigena TaxID=86838 RepID=UPI00317FAF36
MPGKSTSKRSAPGKTSSTASKKQLKPSLLDLKPPTKQKKRAKGAHKAADTDVREQLDGDREALRVALDDGSKKKPLLQKKEAPKELAQAGDPLAQSMDELLDMF